jgi:hypothetical protein
MTTQKPEQRISFFKMHKASLLVIAAAIIVSAFIFFSPVFSTSTNPCGPCHSGNGYRPNSFKMYHRAILTDFLRFCGISCPKSLFLQSMHNWSHVWVHTWNSHQTEAYFLKIQAILHQTAIQKLLQNRTMINSRRQKLYGKREKMQRERHTVCNSPAI